MEGYSLLRMLRELLDETSTSTFLDTRTSYDFLYAAVQDFNIKTHYLTSTQSISVTAGTSAYNLNADFIACALMDDYNRPYIKWTYGSSDSFVFNRDYQEVIIENSTGTANIASSFSINDASAPSNITGTTTADGAASNGECTLTDATAPFTTVKPGDYVHNTTDGSAGVVVAITSTSAIVTALFDGTNNDWTSGDAYVIVKQPRYQMTFRPIPADSATATVYYIQRPDPVYSSFRSYKIPFNYIMPIVKYAAFLYKYKDREPNFGDSFYKYYNAFTRQVASEMRRGIPEKSGMRVNMSKIDARSRRLGGYFR
jgi:hypothetical protein